MPLPRIIYYNFLLNQNLKKSREEILQLREKKFHKLLEYAYHNSKFYQQYYSDHGIKEADLQELNISELPPINKEIMMDNFNQIITDEGITRNRIESFLENSPDPASLFAGKYRVIHSSGSSGKIGYYLYNKKEWDFIKAISLRMFDHFSLRPRRYAFLAAAGGHYAGVSLFLSPVNTFEEFFYDRYLIMNINHPLSEYLEELNNCQPHNLTGYPSAIKILAELERVGKINIAPEVIICGGEPFSGSQKEYISETWPGAELVNYYAASESLMLGVSRREFRGLYLFDDANYFEITDNGYYLTSLYNYTQPLIRYKMNDLLQPVAGEDDFWPFTRVKGIIGRDEETLWFKNSKGEWEFIHPIVLVEFYVRGLKRFQIKQTGEESFLFRVVIEESTVRESVINKIKNKLNNLLSEKELENVDFQIKTVSEIEQDQKTGKFRLIKTKSRRV